MLCLYIISCNGVIVCDIQSSKTYIEKESTGTLQNLSTSTDTLLRLTDTLTLLTAYNPMQLHKVKLQQLTVNEHVQYTDKIINAIQNNIPSIEISIPIVVYQHLVNIRFSERKAQQYTPTKKAGYM